MTVGNIVRPTCDIAGSLPEVHRKEVGLFPEGEQLLCETVRDAQPLQILWLPLLQALQQGREA